MINLFLSSFYLFLTLSLVSTTTKTLKDVALSERLILLNLMTLPYTGHKFNIKQGFSPHLFNLSAGNPRLSLKTASVNSLQAMECLS